MCEDDFLSQHYYFLHDKSPSNDESSTSRSMSICSWRIIFRDCTSSQNLNFLISYKEKSEIFADIIIYMILRITLDNGLYSIIRSCIMRQWAVIFASTFSLHSNSIRTSTVALLMDSFCCEQSVIIKGPLFANVCLLNVSR